MFRLFKKPPSPTTVTTFEGKAATLSIQNVETVNWSHKPAVQKSFVPQRGCERVEAIDFQLKFGSRNFSIADYIAYYESISPLADAIDLLASQFASIRPKVWDKKNKEFIEDHPILNLFQNPNTTVDYLEFAEQEMSFFELTGNCFWIVTSSRLDGEPISLECVPPQWISPTIGADGYVDNFNYTPINSGFSTQFKRVIKPGEKIFRYLSSDGNQEMFQLKRFNPNSGGFRIFGISKLRSMAYQLEHFRDACLHNIALLENSAMPSGMLTASGDFQLMPDQLNDLRAEMDNLFSGAANAGRIMVTDHLEWKPFGLTNKDMDYIEARSQLKEEIYNRLKIPLALINSNALSLANMSVAERQLYNLSILPAADKIFSALTMHLMFRYPDGENLCLTYDPCTIPALKEQTIDELTKMAKLNVMSDAEIRLRLDLPEANNAAADEIYKPSNSIPAYGVVDEQSASPAG